ncbi:MAG: hypothetical protein IJL02_11945 [Methanobrevibacter sp.]|uniref:hypothetical protein n=1 Tax=Methanobrevibacter sp. TaxID=66852 RepID=UPI0025D431E9|nr:hypothetical protein [Methanobrevibacter sp.]MBQ6100559.1 hypothetical protein [Methanobrevibacter sp.]
MVKVEIELTDEQFEKLEILKANDVDPGQAIDLLFGVQKEAIIQVEDQNGADNLLDKLSGSDADAKIKQELLERNFDVVKSYDRSMQEAKHKIKWSEVFKF